MIVIYTLAGLLAAFVIFACVFLRVASNNLKKPDWPAPLV